jgi:hypothetical protein
VQSGRGFLSRAWAGLIRENCFAAVQKMADSSES